MLKLSLKNLLANKIRFFLTGFAVVLGVSFVVAAFVLSDTLDKAFDEISAGIAEAIDVQVQGEGAFENATAVSLDVLDELRAEPNVEAAMAVVGGAPGQVFATKLDGERVGLGAFGPPMIGISVDPNPSNQVTNFNLIDGEWAGAGEVAVDVDTAERDELAIGDTIKLFGSANQLDLEVSGIVRFGESNGAGAQYLVFSPATGQELIGLDPNTSQTIDLAAIEGVSEEELKADVERTLGDGFIVKTGEEVRKDFEDQFGQFVDILRGVFLGFAFVSLFVSSFLINNTFSIVIGQRIRELGLLRAVGATGRQVAFAVVVEALLIGFVASIIGFFVGLGLAGGLKAFLDAAGFLPEGPLQWQNPRTLIVAVLIGVVVTFVASLVPARKAIRIPPIAALRDGVSLDGTGRLMRTIFGILTAVLAALLLAIGLTSNAQGIAAKLVPLGVGAVLSFLAVTILSPLFAGPVASILGAPLRALGTPGQLAQQNAARSPRRTSATAAALMIGLSLVTLASVVGSSIKSTVSDTLDTSIRADFFVQGSGFSPFSQSLGDDLETLPETATVFRYRASLRQQKVLVRGGGKDFVGITGDTLDATVDPGFVSGSGDGLADDGIILFEEPANDLDLEVGDTLQALFPTGVQRELTVRGIYDDPVLLGNWAVDLSLFEEGFDVVDQADLFLATTVADTVAPAGIDEADLAAADTAMKAVADPVPNAELQDLTEYKKTQAAQLDGFLRAINIFLALAVIIAVLGIANTLALSVFERTREIGLLRAVGMVRGQARTMISGEAVVVSLFGTALGVALGLILGIGLTRALPSSVVNTLSLPWGTIIALFIMALVAGLIAAIFPARRAAKLDVLDAISGI